MSQVERYLIKGRFVLSHLVCPHHRTEGMAGEALSDVAIRPSVRLSHVRRAKTVHFYGYYRTVIRLGNPTLEVGPTDKRGP